MHGTEKMHRSEVPLKRRILPALNLRRLLLPTLPLPLMLIILLVLMLLMLLAAGDLFGAETETDANLALGNTQEVQNSQDLIPVGSRAYEYLQIICADQRQIPPIIERPVSRARFLDILNGIEFDSLSSPAQKLYWVLLEEISPNAWYTKEDGLSFDASVLVNFEGYGKAGEAYADEGATNAEEDETDAEAGEAEADVDQPDSINWYAADDEWRPFRPPLINLPLEAWFGENVYSRLELPVQKQPFLDERVPEHAGSWNNVPADFDQVDYQFPYTAYVSAGGEHWHLQLGRDVLDYGSGRSGNLLIGDHIPYYSSIRGSTTWDAFSFYYTAIDLEPWETGAEHIGSKEGIDRNTLVQRILLNHGFMFTPSPRLRIGLKEASLMTTFNPSLNYLNPLMLFHNWYWEGGNSFLSLDAEFLLARGISLYGIFALDQFQTFYEVERYSADSIPNAFGWLIGTEFAFPRSDGFLQGNVEWVYTNPWLYIQENSNASLIWTGHMEDNVAVEYLKHLPLGYPSGPDSMHVFAELGWLVPGSWSLSGEYRYTLKGEQNLEETVYPEDSEMADAAALRTPTGIPERGHVFRVEATCFPSAFPFDENGRRFVHLLNSVEEIGAAAAFFSVQNAGNVGEIDLQGFQWEFFVSLGF